MKRRAGSSASRRPRAAGRRGPGRRGGGPAPTLATVAVLAGSVLAQNKPVGTNGMPWPTRLGARVLAVDLSCPVVDRVVLVPDAATYLDELARWSPAGRWPVLMEDERLNGMFIRRFAPAQIIRRESVGALPPTREALQKACKAVAVSAWGGAPGADELADILRVQGYEPPGVVLASVDDPAWPAAVALSAGRAQPIAWFDADYRRPDDLLPEAEGRRLVEQVTRIVADTGYAYADLGDAIEAITICRSIAGRVRANPLPEGRVALPDADTSGPVAVTDLLGRHTDGRRYAFCGWIFGSEAQSAYMAMCSLFLQRTRVLMFNTYGDDGHWASYAIETAAGRFRERGYGVESRAGPRAGWSAWRRMLPGGVDVDLLLLNTQGMAESFDVKGTMAFSQDVPLLRSPLALHMIHSWSLRSPESLATIGAQWLMHGVYAYVGSVHEPFLTAFVTPDELARRIGSHIPLLVAARQWNGPLSSPWRVQTVGDPLMLQPPPIATQVPERLEPTARDGNDLLEQAKSVMRQADENGAAVELAEAIRTVSLIGRDDVALQLWRLAVSRDAAAAAAPAALATLFRTRQVSEFLEAWSYLRITDHVQRDMLWHLVGPRLGPATDDRTLLALRDAMRRPRVHVDLERLAPHLKRAFGQGFVRGVIQREIEQSYSPAERRELQRLMRRY